MYVFLLVLEVLPSLGTLHSGILHKKFRKMPNVSFRIANSLAGLKNPVLVFGPDLHKNIQNLAEVPAHLQNVPEKIQAASGNQTCRKLGSKFWNIDTSKFSRNISKSGITLTKPIVSWLRASAKCNDLDDDLVDRNLISVVGRKEDMAPLALVIARTFPKYDMKNLKSQLENPENREIVLNFVSTDDNNQSDKSSLKNLIENVRDAARVTDTPCNYMHTAALEEEARAVVASLNRPNCTIEVIQSDELKARGFGMLHSVGQASAEGRKARLVILKYLNGDDKKNVCWVGKGIVYDTGGLSIKTKTGMPGMKCDMGGSAGVLFAFKQAVQDGFKENLYCLLCVAENSVGPYATRPDDIITAYSGLTVDINNTDAEGRLAVGDGVAYASRDLKADIILDMCTLTGAQGISTGKIHAGLLTNTLEMEAKFIKAGMASGDHIFPLVYAPELLIHEFDAPCSDLMNSVAGRSNAQSSCAGHFIEAHLKDGRNWEGTWMHIDMAYPVGSLYDKDRANGYGVALLQKAFSEFFDDEGCVH